MRAEQQNFWAAIAHRLGLSAGRRLVALILVGVVLSLAITACSHGRPGDRSAAATNRAVELTLVSFIVTRAAYEAIIPQFVAQWQQVKGQTVSFKRSYGGSGSQTRAVIDGLEADVVHLALALDTQKIAKAGLIQPGWQKAVPNHGIVTKSVAALITRAGNPQGIKDWADLAKPGLKIITADPKTSGVARWNFLALWNAAIQAGGDAAKATEFVTQVYKNVPILTKDAREAMDVFAHQGQGDALINYENEIILAQQKGQKADFVIPAVNISIDNPIAVVDRNVDKHGNREVAEAFVQFLFTPTAQQEFAKVGFRPVHESVARTKEFSAKYPTVKNLATVQEYGDWDTVQSKFFADGALFDQIQAKIRR
jgi:sulfate/thiosulfate transport system substrate-binding protein